MSFKLYQNVPVYKNYKGFSDKPSYNHPIIIYSEEKLANYFNLGWVLISAVVNNLHESQDILSLICRPMRPSNYYFKSPLRLFQCSFFSPALATWKLHSLLWSALLGKQNSKLYIPSTTNTWLIIWHTKKPIRVHFKAKLTVVSTFC